MRRAWSLPSIVESVAVLTALAAFQPVLVRTAILRSGPVALHVSLIDLDQYGSDPWSSRRGPRRGRHPTRAPEIIVVPRSQPEFDSKYAKLQT